MFEKNDFLSNLETFGIDLTSLIGVQNYDKHGQHSGFSGKFLSSKEGFQRGSLYKNEYKPYKNMTYLEVVPKSEREMHLFKIYELSFAITDLSFHLDLHANDKEAFELFKVYSNELEKAKKEYVAKFGPLCVENTAGQVYDWVDNPWPWDKDMGDMYV